MVTLENYEEYLMMQADGELDAQELTHLQAFLDAHPELAAEAATWQDLKLVPDANIRYAQPGTLLREDRRAVAFRPWYVGVPAAAALLLALFLLPRNDQPRTTAVAQNTAPVIPAPAPQTRIPAEPLLAAVPVTNQPGPFRPRPRPRPRHIASRKLADAPATRGSIPDALVQSGNVVTVLPENLTSVPLTGVQPAVDPEEKPVLIAVADAPAPAAEAAARRRIQLAPANQEALDALRAGIDQRIEQVGRVAKTVRESAVTVRFGGNAFHINL